MKQTLLIFAALSALWLAPNLYAAEVGDDEALLRWEPPTQNVDGSDLPECPPGHVEGDPTDPDCLDGFVAHYGTESRNYTETITIEDQAQRELLLQTLPPATYFFAMTAYDSGGDVSAYSGEVSKTIVDSSPPVPPVTLPSESEVFTVKMQPDVFLLFNIGIVPAGTLCWLDRGAPAGYGVVPFDEVVWTDPNGPRPVAVVARCD